MSTQSNPVHSSIVLLILSITLLAVRPGGEDDVVFLPLVAGGASATTTATPMSTSTVEPTPTPMSTATPTATTVVPGDSNDAALGLTTSLTFQNDIQELRTFGAQAIFAASIAANTGSLVTTGSITVNSDGTTRYSDTPADRLRVILADGRAIDLYTTTFTGNFNGDYVNYLRSNHNFAMRIVTDPTLAGYVHYRDSRQEPLLNVDVQLMSRLNSGTIFIHVTGEMEHGGPRYTVDLTAEGSYYFESSSGGAEEQVAFTLTGTINGDGLVLQVNEGYANELIVASGQSASTANTTVSNIWSYNDVNYAVQNGLIQRSFRDGKPSQLDNYWKAEGQLMQNGQTVGNLTLENGSIYVKVLLQLGAEQVELQRFQH